MEIGIEAEIQISINGTSELIETLKRRIQRENPPPDIEELILMNICILQNYNDQLQSLIDPERVLDGLLKDFE